METSVAIYLSVFWIVLIAITWYFVDLFGKRRAFAFGSVWLIVLVALIVRLVPAIASGYDPRFNNYDIDSYQIDFQSILTHVDIYTNPAAEWRHPYLPFQIYLIAAAGVFADLFHVPFIPAVKFLPVLADVGIAGLVYAGALSQWQDREKAFRLGLLYALNPVSILIVAYHGQFDSIPIFLSLAAWCVLEFRKPAPRTSIAAGLLLGLAILDKTWPVIFVPVFLLRSADGWRKLIFLAGVVIPPILGVMIYALLFSTAPIKILSSSTLYGSVWAFWGWTYIAALLAGSVPPTMGLGPLGRVVLLGSLFLFYVFVSRRQTFIAALLGTILVLFATTFGFSVQYLMWPLPFALLAGERSWMRWYVGMASLWLAGYYFGWYGLARELGPWVFWAPVVLWLYVVAWMIANLRRIALPAVDRYLVLCTLFALVLSIPLLVPGYIFTAYNGRFSTFLLYEFDRVIGDGILYPRWLPDFTFGYGYPYFDVYSPGAYYAAEALHLIAFDFVSSVKVVFALSLILSGLATFGFVRRLTGRSETAFVAALAFVGLIPFILEAFATTAFEAAVALALLPLVLWESYELIRRPRGITIAGTAIAIAALILTHAGLALVIAPLFGIWALIISIREMRSGTLRFPRPTLPRLTSPIPVLFVAVGLGLGLAAIFVIPAAVEYTYVQIDPSWIEYYGGLGRLLNLQAFAARSAEMASPGRWVPVLALPLLTAIVYIVASARRTEIGPRFYPLYGGLVAAAALLMLWFFAAPGQWLSLLNSATLPWKLLILAVTFGAIVAAIGIMRMEWTGRSRSSSLLAILTGALILLGSQLALFHEIGLAEEPNAITVADLINYQKETGAMVSAPAWAKEIPQGSDMADAWSAGLKIRTRIVTTDYPQEVLWIGVLPGGSGMHTNGERIAFTSNADDLTVTLKAFYFPGWHAYLVKPWSTEIIQELAIQPISDSGQMQVNVKRGADQWLLFQFQDTPARVAGQWISATFALLVLGMLAWGVRPQASEHASRPPVSDSVLPRVLPS